MSAHDGTAEAARVLVTDPIASDGVEYLRARTQVEVVQGKLSTAELVERIGAFGALVVRSETRVTREVIDAGRNLRGFPVPAAEAAEVDPAAARVREQDWVL